MNNVKGYAICQSRCGEKPIEVNLSETNAAIDKDRNRVRVTKCPNCGGAAYVDADWIAVPKELEDKSVNDISARDLDDLTHDIFTSCSDDPVYACEVVRKLMRYMLDGEVVG